MTIEEMRCKKQELGLTGEMISRLSGIPLSTVQKVFGGATKAPRKQTLIAMETALREEEKKRKGSDHEPSAEAVGETAWKYCAAGKTKYTIDDYYALPEDRRVELIDGVIYDMTAPLGIHQMILGDLYILFRECADRHGMPCAVLLSPYDVRLDRDMYTMVQPDLIVACGEYDEESAVRFEGAPDLVVEILSPSTRSKDQVLKLYKYQNAGVREYWIVDPKLRVVTVHRFGEEDYSPQRYDFESEIPVGISGGQCVIDFSRVGKRPFRD